MARKRCFVGPALLLCLAVPPAWAQSVDEGPRHGEIGSLEEILDRLDAGELTLRDVRRMGLRVFSLPFNSYDGMGDGPFDVDEWFEDPVAFGHRPTLQGNGQFLRVNGLDAQSCNECHSVVSNRTDPPTLGIGGVGSMVQTAIIMPSLIDVADSGDDRMIFQPGHEPSLTMEADGKADFNGRFANPPFLFGGGGVEMLAKEMTADLQAQLGVARSSSAGTVVALETHGVSFGSLVSLGGGEVDLSGVEGVGPADRSGVAAEQVLVVRPFGRKGDNFSMRDFDRGAMQFHFGMQPVEVVDAAGTGNVDEDGDGVGDEVTVAEMSVLHIFDVTNPVPRIAPLGAGAQLGYQSFLEVGCADCHRPTLETASKRLPLAHPENPIDPWADVYLRIDLTEVGFARNGAGGVVVPLFADLKRHRMGERLAETFERADLHQDEFTTARLWGVADTAPYLHDGRATTLYQAIEFHGGEAQAARDAFLALPEPQQRNVLKFLKRLRVPRDPNRELLASQHSGENEDLEEEEED